MNSSKYFTIILQTTNLYNFNTLKCSKNISYPKYLINNEGNTITFQFYSPSGYFDDYGYNITYNGVSYYYDGDNAYGETLSRMINITNATIDSKVYVTYYYKLTTTGITKEFTDTYSIEDIGLGDFLIGDTRYYEGIGLVERVIILLLVVFLIGSVAYIYSNKTGLIVVVIIILSYMTKIQFISKWITIPTILFLVLVGFLGGKR
jgi:hypothetical protein